MHRSENEILIQGLGSFYRGDWEPRSAVGGYEHFESKVMRSNAAVSMLAHAAARDRLSDASAPPLPVNPGIGEIAIADGITICRRLV